MKTFNKFINENNAEKYENMIDTISYIVKDNSGISIDMEYTTRDRTMKITSLMYQSFNGGLIENIIVNYYVNGGYMSNSIRGMSDKSIEKIYNYIKENYPEYEHYFTGKDMGLL